MRPCWAEGLKFKRISYSSKKYSVYQGQKESARSARISQAEHEAKKSVTLVEVETTPSL